MKQTVLPLLALTMLAACSAAQPQQPQQSGRIFRNYEAFLADYTFEHVRDRPNVPPAVTMGYADCAAAYTVTGFTPVELSRLDAWAQRRVELSAAELSDLDRKVSERIGSLKFDDLSGTCPDQVPLFKKYLG